MTPPRPAPAARRRSDGEGAAAGPRRRAPSRPLLRPTGLDQGLRPAPRPRRSPLTAAGDRTVPDARLPPPPPLSAQAGEAGGRRRGARRGSGVSEPLAVPTALARGCRCRCPSARLGMETAEPLRSAAATQLLPVGEVVAVKEETRAGHAGSARSARLVLSCGGRIGGRLCGQQGTARARGRARPDPRARRSAWPARSPVAHPQLWTVTPRTALLPRPARLERCTWSASC